MTADGLHVRGGSGGTTATVEAVRAAGADLVDVGLALGALVPEVGRVLAHPAVLLAAALDPFGGARVVAAGASAVAGPGGLVAAAAACCALGTAVLRAAEAYRLAETEVSDLVARVPRLVAPSAGLVGRHLAAAGAPLVGPPLLAAVVVGVGAWVVVRAVPVVAVAAARAADLARRGALDPGSAALLGVLAAQRLRERLVADVARVAAAAQVAMAEHPWLLREVLAGLPAAVAGAVPVGGASRRLLPDSYRELAVGVALLGAATGAARQGTVEVTRVRTRRTTPADGTAGLLARLAPAVPPGGGVLRLDRVEGAGGTRWVLWLPPTQTWDTGGGPEPADGTANLRLVGGLDADSVEAARAVLRAAGVPPGEPVLAVGYSQGGMAAAALAADPDLPQDVQAVLTAGSPVSQLVVPDDVAMLSVEHVGDPTVELDAARNPDRPGWTTVERDLLDPDGGDPQVRAELERRPWGGHDLAAYLRTAALVDRSEHPSVLGWRARAAPFLDPGAEVTTTTWVAERTVP